MKKDDYISRKDELFDLWKKKYLNKEFNHIELPHDFDVENNFVYDGILDFDIFEQQHPKILFLLKETFGGFTNISGKMYINEGSSNDFWPNVARWKIALKEIYKKPDEKPDFYSYGELIKRYGYIDDIALVNIKKIDLNLRGSNNKDIDKFAKEDKDFLKKQIEIINPHIIFCGGTFDSYEIMYDYEQMTEIQRISFVKSGKTYKESCFLHNNRLVIDYFHPHQQFHSQKNLFDYFCKMLIEGKVFQHFRWK